MGSTVLFGEMRGIITPMGQGELVSLDSPSALAILGRFAEALVVYDHITVPLRGPALEAVALIRWLGPHTFQELHDEGVIRFAFAPGVFGHVSPQNIRALRLTTPQPGITTLIGHDDAAWRDVQASLEGVLRRQLGWPDGKARRWARRIALSTEEVPASELREASIKLGYHYATSVLGVKHSLRDEQAWRTLDNGNERDKPLIRELLMAVDNNFQWLLSAVLRSSDVFGNDALWRVVRHNFGATKSPQATAENLERILRYEDYPDLAALVSRGLTADHIVRIRQDRRSKEFRQWLDELPRSLDDIGVIKAYNNAVQRATQTTLVKILRVGVGVGMSYVGVLPATIYATLDVLFGDRILPPWNPRVYIAKHFEEWRDRTK